MQAHVQADFVIMKLPHNLSDARPHTVSLTI